MAQVAERSLLTARVLDGPLDAHARAVANLLHCDAALVTIIDHEHQHFVGLHAPPGVDGLPRTSPLQWSLCRTVAAQTDVLVLDDLGADPTFRDHRAFVDFGVAAYVGVPLASPSGEVVGAVCGVNLAPRHWSDEDVERLTDVRDLVQAELRPLLRRQRQAARSDEISLLLSTLRHELGGELAIVLGGLETALLPGLDETLRTRVLTNARRDCRRVIATLDALLRMDSRSPLQLRRVDLVEIVGEALDGLRATRDADRLDVDVTEAHLTTEPTLLGHVVRNLVENAYKYTREQIRIVGRATEHGARIVVSDTGDGLPEDVLRQLYEPFRRHQDSEDASGFGLGFYIIRTLCQRIGAELAVDTGSRGTTITIDVADRQSPKPSKAASSSDGA